MTNRLTIVILGSLVAIVAASCAKKDVKTDTAVDGMSASAGVPVTPPSPDQANDLKKVYFDTDKATLRADAKRDLRNDVSWLKSHPKDKVTIEGNCDERGSDEYNDQLGQRRADAVKHYLVRHGIKSKRLTTKSFGKSQPVDPGHDESAWRQNRRVSFRVNG